MNKYYAVIDTNILVSGLLIHDSNPGNVLDFIFSGVIIPLVNNEIIQEYQNVLTRDKFKFEKADVDNILNVFREKGLFFDRTKAEDVFVDQSDIVFYEITLSGRNIFDTYLITGNLKHFPVKNFVITPRTMLDIINSNN